MFMFRGFCWFTSRENFCVTHFLTINWKRICNSVVTILPMFNYFSIWKIENFDVVIQDEIARQNYD